MKLLLLLFSFLFCSLSWAQKTDSVARIQGVTVQADSMVRDNENETIELDGNVQVVFKSQHLSCDHAVVNLRAKTLDARGNVLIISEQANAGGDRILLDYENNTGVIFGGYVQSGRVLFEGNLINKLNEDEYTTGDSRYTTCTTCPEAWSFSGSRLRAEMGGYAYIKNAIMRISGIPIIWIPYLVVPLKSDRQSGLLTPGFETSSSGGFTISESYFWAISRSQDTTITAKNYEFRGMKGMLNYRYMLSKDSGGELDAATLHDRVFGNDSRLNTFRDAQEKGQPINRWFIKYQHYYDMPDGYVARAQINDASDLQYPKDFPLETQNLGDSSMESRVSLTKNTLSQHYSVDASYYNNLLQSDPLAGNNDSVQRLPELKFSQVETRLGTSDYLFSMDVDYANFARANFGYDEMSAPYVPGTVNDRHVVATGSGACSGSNWEQDPNCHPDRSGSFDPNKDLIRTGQRLDFQPTLYRPIKVGSLDLLPKLSYRETQYAFPVGQDSFYARRYVRAEVSARTTFSGVFGDQATNGDRIKHEIQPELTYTEIPWIYQPNHPFFGYSQQAETPSYNQLSVSDANLNGPEGLQFDYNDRVYDRKVATLGITNRLTEKKWIAGVPQYRQFLSWRVAESFDIYQSQQSSATGTAQPWSDLISDLKFDMGKFQVYQLMDYYPYQHVTNNSSRLRYTNDAGDFLQIEYLLSYNITPGQPVDKNTRTEYYTWSAKKRYRFIDFIGKVNYDANAEDKVGIKSWGYGTQLKMPGDCFFFNITHYHVIGGDTNFLVSFNFIWDGKDVPQLPDSMLNSFGF